MKICDWKGCQSGANYQVVFRAWALGYPKEPGNSLLLYFAVGLCTVHKDEPKAEEFFLPESCAMINQRLSDNHKASLNLSDVEYVPTLIENDRFRMS